MLTSNPSAALTGPVSFAVFPLDEVVFFPTLSVPLRIFEPRYQQMLDDALAARTLIALCPLEPRLGSVEQDLIVGAGLPQLISEQPDRSRIILLHGAGRARIRSIEARGPYLWAQGEWAPTRDEALAGNRFFLRRLERRLAEEAARSRPDPRVPQALGLPARVVELAALFLIPEPEARQEFLELDDINDRLSVLKDRLRERELQELHAAATTPVDPALVSSVPTLPGPAQPQ